jgi:hypothetical protein
VLVYFTFLPSPTSARVEPIKLPHSIEISGVVGRVKHRDEKQEKYNAGFEVFTEVVMKESCVLGCNVM